MYGTGNQYNDGAGIRLAQSAGAQMGKNFSTSINESGACNMKSADRFVSLSDCNDTPVFSLPLFGGLMVNKHGSRFMDEGTMAKHTMYCGEPLLRENGYRRWTYKRHHPHWTSSPRTPSAIWRQACRWD